MTEVYIYNDLILYAKGWYQHSENICEDLGYIFSKVYGWTPKTEDEVSFMMLRALDNLHEKLGVTRGCSTRWLNTLSSFESEIRNRMNIYECTREHAIILAVLAVFQGLEKSEIDIEPPYYGRGEHFRMGCAFGGKYSISMTYTEMNRRAEKMFGRTPKKAADEMWRKILK